MPRRNLVPSLRFRAPRPADAVHINGKPIGMKRVVLVRKATDSEHRRAVRPKKFRRRSVLPLAPRGSHRRGAARIPDADAQSQVPDLGASWCRPGGRFRPDRRAQPATDESVSQEAALHSVSRFCLRRRSRDNLRRWFTSESRCLSRRDQKSRHQEGVNVFHDLPRALQRRFRRWCKRPQMTDAPPQSGKQMSSTDVLNSSARESPAAELWAI